jgi:hypothetical protein
MLGCGERRTPVKNLYLCGSARNPVLERLEFPVTTRREKFRATACAILLAALIGIDNPSCRHRPTFEKFQLQSQLGFVAVAPA